MWPYDYYEDNTYARATKAFESALEVPNDEGVFNPNWPDYDVATSYAPSDWDYTYDGENGLRGKTPRTGVSLRIRAAYIPPNGVTIK